MEPMSQSEHECIPSERRLAYVNDELDAAAASAVAEHCRQCATCDELMQRTIEEAEEADRNAVHAELGNTESEAKPLPAWLGPSWERGVEDLRRETETLASDQSFEPARWQGAALVERLLAFVSAQAPSWKQRVNVAADWSRKLDESADAAETEALRAALLTWLRDEKEHWQVRKAAAEALGLAPAEAASASLPRPGVLDALVAAYGRSSAWLADVCSAWLVELDRWNTRGQGVYGAPPIHVAIAGLDCKSAIVEGRTLFTWTGDVPLALWRVGVRYRAADVASEAAWKLVHVPLLFDPLRGGCLAIAEVPVGAQIELLPLEPPSGTGPVAALGSVAGGAFASAGSS
jgi:hypothetical protein